jgi:UrcA family protein
MPRFLLAAGLAALITGPAVTSATAADRHIDLATQVKTSDLNLATEQGARLLLRRVNVAADDLCALSGSPYFGTTFADEVNCHDKAVADAVRRLNAPMVTAEYRRRLGAPPSRIAAR